MSSVNWTGHLNWLTPFYLPVNLKLCTKNDEKWPIQMTSRTRKTEYLVIFSCLCVYKMSLDLFWNPQQLKWNKIWSPGSDFILDWWDLCPHLEGFLLTFELLALELLPQPYWQKCWWRVAFRSASPSVCALRCLVKFNQKAVKVKQLALRHFPSPHIKSKSWNVRWEEARGGCTLWASARLLVQILGKQTGHTHLSDLSHRQPAHLLDANVS